MERDLNRALLQWKNQPQRMPILLRGARQVGKTHLITQFAKQYFKHFIYINFELQPKLCDCFEILDALTIIQTLQLMTNQPIVPGESFLFLDEIQDCPNAIRALRYFKEQIPELHVVGAGSLLEFTLNDSEFRMPVGRVQPLYLRPLSFKEFLTASGKTKLRQYLENISIHEKIPHPIHQQLLQLIRYYLFLGGMPAVIQEYINSNDLLKAQHLQSALLNNYRNDFGKYASGTQHRHVQQLFEKIPGFIAQRFKYTKVDPDTRSRDLKIALNSLEDAGLIYPVIMSAASGLPLAAQTNEKNFKILFLDVGLVNCTLGITDAIFKHEDFILVNRGALAEQFVGQELLAYADPHTCERLFFWDRDKKNSLAEVDYVISIDTRIIPIEVKAGKTGQLKSLHLFLDEKKANLGIQISQRSLQLAPPVLNIPFYLISEIPRFIRALR